MEGPEGHSRALHEVAGLADGRGTPAFELARGGGSKLGTGGFLLPSAQQRGELVGQEFVFQEFHARGHHKAAK
jgi:hypothetical protein